MLLSSSLDLIEKRLQNTKKKDYGEELRKTVDGLGKQVVDFLNQNEQDAAKQVLDFLIKLTGKNDRYPLEKVKTLNHIGCYYRRKGQHQSALDNLHKALKILDIHHIKDHKGITYLNICAILTEQNRQSEALSAANHAVTYTKKDFLSTLKNIAIPEKTRQSKAKYYAIALNSQAVQLENIGQVEQAKNVYTESCVIMEEHFGKADPLSQLFRKSLETLTQKILNQNQNNVFLMKFGRMTRSKSDRTFAKQKLDHSELANQNLNQISNQLQKTPLKQFHLNKQLIRPKRSVSSFHKKSSSLRTLKPQQNPQTSQLLPLTQTKFIPKHVSHAVKDKIQQELSSIKSFSTQYSMNKRQTKGLFTLDFKDGVKELGSHEVTVGNKIGIMTVYFNKNTQTLLFQFNNQYSHCFNIEKLKLGEEELEQLASELVQQLEPYFVVMAQDLLLKKNYQDHFKQSKLCFLYESKTQTGISYKYYHDLKKTIEKNQQNQQKKQIQKNRQSQQFKQDQQKQYIQQDQHSEILKKISQKDINQRVQPVHVFSSFQEKKEKENLQKETIMELGSISSESEKQSFIYNPQLEITKQSRKNLETLSQNQVQNDLKENNQEIDQEEDEQENEFEQIKPQCIEEKDQELLQSQIYGSQQTNFSQQKCQQSVQLVRRQNKLKSQINTVKQMKQKMGSMLQIPEKKAQVQESEIQDLEIISDINDLEKQVPKEQEKNQVDLQKPSLQEILKPKKYTNDKEIQRHSSITLDNKQRNTHEIIITRKSESYNRNKSMNQIIIKQEIQNKNTQKVQIINDQKQDQVEQENEILTEQDIIAQLEKKIREELEHKFLQKQYIEDEKIAQRYSQLSMMEKSLKQRQSQIEGNSNFNEVMEDLPEEKLVTGFNNIYKIKIIKQKQKYYQQLLKSSCFFILVFTKFKVIQSQFIVFKVFKQMEHDHGYFHCEVVNCRLPKRILEGTKVLVNQSQISWVKEYQKFWHLTKLNFVEQRITMISPEIFQSKMENLFTHLHKVQNNMNIETHQQKFFFFQIIHKYIELKKELYMVRSGLLELKNTQKIVGNDEIFDVNHQFQITTEYNLQDEQFQFTSEKKVEPNVLKVSFLNVEECQQYILKLKQNNIYNALTDSVSIFESMIKDEVRESVVKIIYPYVYEKKFGNQKYRIHIHVNIQRLYQQEFLFLRVQPLFKRLKSKLVKFDKQMTKKLKILKLCKTPNFHNAIIDCLDLKHMLPSDDRNITVQKVLCKSQQARVSIECIYEFEKIMILLNSIKVMEVVIHSSDKTKEQNNIETFERLFEKKAIMLLNSQQMDTNPKHHFQRLDQDKQIFTTLRESQKSLSKSQLEKKCQQINTEKQDLEKEILQAKRYMKKVRLFFCDNFVIFYHKNLLNTPQLLYKKKFYFYQQKVEVSCIGGRRNAFLAVRTYQSHYVVSQVDYHFPRENYQKIRILETDHFMFCRETGGFCLQPLFQDFIGVCKLSMNPELIEQMWPDAPVLVVKQDNPDEFCYNYLFKTAHVHLNELLYFSSENRLPFQVQFSQHDFKEKKYSSFQKRKLFLLQKFGNNFSLGRAFH